MTLIHSLNVHTNTLTCTSTFRHGDVIAANLFALDLQDGLADLLQRGRCLDLQLGELAQRLRAVRHRLGLQASKQCVVTVDHSIQAARGQYQGHVGSVSRLRVDSKMAQRLSECTRNVRNAQQFNCVVFTFLLI